MNKKLIFGQFVTGISGAAIHYLVTQMLGTKNDFVWAYYLFFFVSAAFISSYCERYYKIKPDKVGLMFVALMFVKMLLFTLFFSAILFFGETLGYNERLNILVPFALFLFVEAWAVYRILNSISDQTK